MEVGFSPCTTLEPTPGTKPLPKFSGANRGKQNDYTTPLAETEIQDEVISNVHAVTVRSFSTMKEHMWSQQLCASFSHSLYYPHLDFFLFMWLITVGQLKKLKRYKSSIIFLQVTKYLIQTSGEDTLCFTTYMAGERGKCIPKHSKEDLVIQLVSTETQLRFTESLDTASFH